MAKREPGYPTPEFKSQHGSSSVTPFPTSPALSYTCQRSAFFCLSGLPLLVWAGMAPQCRVNCLPVLLPRCSQPLSYIGSRVSVTPVFLAPSRHSYLTLLKHWPSSLDKQSNSQWPCSTSLLWLWGFSPFWGASSSAPHYKTVFWAGFGSSFVGLTSKVYVSSGFRWNGYYTLKTVMYLQTF